MSLGEEGEAMIKPTIVDPCKT